MAKEYLTVNGKLVTVDGKLVQVPDPENTNDLVDEQARYATQFTNTVAEIEDILINGVIDGSPKGVFNNANELRTTYPNGASGVYLTADNGHWWYYNNGWQDGGIYRSDRSDSVNTEYIRATNADITDSLSANEVEVAETTFINGAGVTTPKVTVAGVNNTTINEYGVDTHTLRNSEHFSKSGCRMIYHEETDKYGTDGVVGVGNEDNTLILKSAGAIKVNIDGEEKELLIPDSQSSTEVFLKNRKYEFYDEKNINSIVIDPAKGEIRVIDSNRVKINKEGIKIKDLSDTNTLFEITKDGVITSSNRPIWNNGTTSKQLATLDDIPSGEGGSGGSYPTNPEFDLATINNLHIGENIWINEEHGFSMGGTQLTGSFLLIEGNGTYRTWVESTRVSTPNIEIYGGQSSLFKHTIPTGIGQSETKKIIEFEDGETYLFGDTSFNTVINSVTKPRWYDNSSGDYKELATMDDLGNINAILDTLNGEVV